MPTAVGQRMERILALSNAVLDAVVRATEPTARDPRTLFESCHKPAFTELLRVHAEYVSLLRHVLARLQSVPPQAPDPTLASVLTLTITYLQEQRRAFRPLKLSVAETASWLQRCPLEEKAALFLTAVLDYVPDGSLSQLNRNVYAGTGPSAVLLTTPGEGKELLERSGYWTDAPEATVLSVGTKKQRTAKKGPAAEREVGDPDPELIGIATPSLIMSVLKVPPDTMSERPGVSLARRDLESLKALVAATVGRTQERWCRVCERFAALVEESESILAGSRGSGQALVPPR